MTNEDTMVKNQIIALEEDVVHNTTGIGADVMVVKSTVILHITVGHTECVPIRAKTGGPWNTDTRRMRCVTIRCQEVSKTAPDRSGQHMPTFLDHIILIKLLWHHLEPVW